MKRIFFVLVTVVLVLMAVMPCFAQETLTVEEIPTGTVEVGAKIKDWVTVAYEWTMSHWDDIMGIVLFVAAIIYKFGSGVFKNKILPELQAQGNTTIAMASAAGKLTQATKENFDKVIKEVKEFLIQAEERELSLTEALAEAGRSKEEYRLLCECYQQKNQEIATALLAQEQMIYDTLMSAKLTDMRKAEIERQHLANKTAYQALAARIEGEANAE